MNFSYGFIQRPIATTLLMLGIALFGVIAYQALPVADLPNVDFPTITVSASLPGADPATMASAVATPLERQFTTIAGIDNMTSSSSMGNTQITLQFDLDRDIDGAAVDVQTAIAACMSLLPPGMPSPPSFRKVNPSDSPVMFLSLVGSALSMSKLDDYAQNVIAQRVSTIPGVAQVDSFGSQKFAVRVKVDPDALAARKIGINEVAAAIRQWNVNQPVGTLWGPKKTYNLQANGQLDDAEGYKSIVLAWRDGSPVRLADVAQVVDSVEEERSIGYLYTSDRQERSINLMVQRQPNSNVIQVNDAIREMIPVIQKQLPPAANLGVRGDRSLVIRESFHEIQFTMAVTIGLVVLVIFIFLRNASATLIPTLALPFSILGTFGVMYLCGYSLNNLSMMALILSVGFIVDDAIVMLENIVRHIERGEQPLEASFLGSKEIWFTIVSMTTSLAAVFIPILFMGGVLGKLFKEFAVSIVAAVMFSGFVSVTLTPMLCSRLLRAHKPEEHGYLYRLTERGFLFSLRMYEISLRWVINHRPVMVVVFFAVLGATVYLYMVVPKGFIPEMDNDQIYVNTEVAQGTAFPVIAAHQARVAKVVQSDPDVEVFFSSVGGSSRFGGASTSNRMFVTLKPRAQREASSQQVAERLRPKLAGFPGIRSVVTVPAAIRLGGRGSRSAYEFTLQAPDTTSLYAEGLKFQNAIARLPIVQEVNSDVQMRSPRLTVDVDRDKAGSFGLDVREIESALYNAYGANWISTIYTPKSQNRVVLEVQDKYQAFGDMISRLYLRAPEGPLVPLDSLAKVKYDVGPQTINHTGQLPSVTVSFNLKPGVALGEAVNTVEELARNTLPGNFTTGFSGTAKVFQDSLKNLSILLAVAIVVVYIVLGVLYESFVHPITILSGLPSAGFGALLTLLLMKTDLSIYSFVGLIMLIGIVKKNAIMQVDFALDMERRFGKPPKEAILEGCVARFRPIMMTTLAAMFGALPLAVRQGAGSETRQPLGIAVVGGLIFSQLLTLYLTPVVYTYLEGIMYRLNLKKRGASEAVIGLPEAAQ